MTELNERIFPAIIRVDNDKHKDKTCGFGTKKNKHRSFEYTKLIHSGSLHKFILTAFLFPAGYLPAQSTDLVVNEFLASNTATNLNPDFYEYDDWIEIANVSASAIALDGYFLTDDFTNPGKWQIPANTTIAPGGYLLFNPTTEIRFQIPTAVQVEISIYNLVGQKVRTLISKHYNPGFHSVQWDGRDKLRSVCPSGIYIYKLQAGSFSKVRRMLLLK